MYIPYDQISNYARVWIYQSDRPFNSSEKTDIEIQLTDLCNNWNTHGSILHCSFQLHDWFICLFVDESKQGASGCSIDSSVAVIKAIANQYNIDFFNRMNIAFLDGESTKVLPIAEFKKQLTPQTVVFNNLVSTKSEYESKWKVPLSESWLARFTD
tara:strand:+ start:2013 stop:2480 length:468 start_codon:yes stop_codon:yes gene_type:complete